MSLEERINLADYRSVGDVLNGKHPPRRPASPDALVSSSELPPEVHPVRFEPLTAASIRAAALRTSRSAGPSGLDAAGWRRLCCSFHKDSSDSCDAIAAFARRICAAYVDPAGLPVFVACRL